MIVEQDVCDYYSKKSARVETCTVITMSYTYT